MKSFSLALSLALVTAGTFSHGVANAAAKVGSPAPDFTLTDTSGKTHTLKSFQGKTVVLEWFNKDCPYVKKHYDSSNMQKLQKKYTDSGVVWLSIVSSAKGNQGYEEPADAAKTRIDLKVANTATLLDAPGTVGKLYAAKTTPHMFVIDPKGMLVYNGAIDSLSSTDAADIPKAKNYLAMALDTVTAGNGKAVEMATTKPYGCSVKY